MSGVNLSRANLTRTDLSNANLSGANLSNANLSGNIFSRYLFSRADRIRRSKADNRNRRSKADDRDKRGYANDGIDGANLGPRDFSKINLSEVNLSGANLSGANLGDIDFSNATLRNANLRNTNLTKTNLVRADLVGANLSSANLSNLDISNFNLTGTNLSGANLSGANLTGTNLSEANLSGANLTRTLLIETKLTHAILTQCSIYGIAAWRIDLEGAIQKDLIITPEAELMITVDNLKAAQFIYLLLNNAEIREVIDTITSKVVLILGRFTCERKAVLDALREELRKRNYSPIVFDFEKPASRDLTGTVSTLAHLARFIVVDLTNPSSAPHEVATIIPQCVVPVLPLLFQEPFINEEKVVRREYAMFQDLRQRYHWVLPTFRYQGIADLLASLQTHVIIPAEQKAEELTRLK